MKHKAVILATLFISFFTQAQDINVLFNDASTAIKEKNVASLENIANQIKNAAPEHYAGHLYLAFTSCLKNDIVSAKKHATIARNLNYIDAANFAIASYIAFLEHDFEESKSLMNASYAIISYENAITDTLDDINWIEKETGIDCTQLKAFANSANQNNPNAVNMMANLFASYPDWQKGNMSVNENSVFNYLSQIKTYGNILLSQYKFNKNSSLFYAGKLDEGAKGFENFVNNTSIKNNPDFNYQLAMAYSYLADYSHYNYNYENALAESNLGLKLLAGYKTAYLEQSLLNYKLKALTGLNKKEEIVSTATKLLNLSKSSKNNKYEAIANNALGQYYSNSALTSSRNKAYTYLNRAYTLANTLDDKSLLSSIGGNYAISLWQKGNKSEAFNVTNKALLIKEELNDISDAQLLANNTGYMSFMQKDYTNATKMFNKSIDLAEKHLNNVTPEIQLTLMNEYSSAYSGLIMVYKETENKAELFKVQDANRSRLLSKNLHQKSAGKNIEDIQNQLSPDDILIYYSLLGPGEMVATTITKTTSNIHYNYPIDSWLKIKSKLLNKINNKPSSINGHIAKINEEIIDNKIISYSNKGQAFKAEHFQSYTQLTRQLLESGKPEHAKITQEFLKQWYSFLITPLKNDLIGKKNLIISGEGVLNYLPFEAFLDNNNQYLIENYAVSYIPSATVWSKLKNRNYTNNRKDLLAMGGATYKNPNTKKTSTRNASDFYKIKKDLVNKINTNKNDLSAELEAIGFGGANYLAGTLKEVQNLQKIVSNSTILTGSEMKESKIKTMNANNELANYKWIHIATHGFALDNIPELSGVMMTQSDDEKAKGEDTFLLAHEIEKLNLKADLVVLSACQTALGKIYRGEGINGLNSSLMVAGANNTLLSLWPVNDAGTMVLMTLVYQNMAIKNQNVSEAITNAKRSMLKGEVGDGFKSVYMWAPFVLNGLGK